MPDPAPENIKAFCAAYAEPVRQHGLAFFYDSGWSTPDEIALVPLNDVAVVKWLSKLAVNESDRPPTLGCCDG